MSARATPDTPPRRPARVARSFAALGLLAAVGVGGLGPLKGQTDDEPDDRRPLPATEPARAALAAKYRIPNPDRAIFQGRRNARTGRVDGGIVDLTPVASEKENADEYRAWHELVQHARQFTAAELEENADRTLTRDDLTDDRTRSLYRLDLIRQDGKLTKVRRVPATRSLREAGVAELYEGLLVPLDEPPTDVVSVVFTELPPEFAAVKERPDGEWLDVDTWASAAGYFFKVKQDAPGDNPADRVPVVIGRSVTPAKDPAAASPRLPGPGGASPVALDRRLRVFHFIKDDAAIARAEDNWEEVSAWNRVLLHARRFTPEELEAHANWDVKFADLFLDSRRDYKLDLVGFEGRLVRLKKLKPGRKLEAAGVESVYEGWLVPKDEPRGNPVCVVFTDPPEGVDPGTQVNKWVSFAGYSFKLLRYVSAEQDKADPTRNVTKRAPLLLGRAVVGRPDPDGPTPVTWRGFMQGAFVVVAALIVIAGGLTWWYRRGDRKTRQEIDGHRGRNPFGG